MLYLETYRLTVDELPAHKHNAASSTTNLTGSTSAVGGETEMNAYTTGVFSWSYIKSERNHDNGNMLIAKINFKASVANSITTDNTGSGAAHNNFQPYLTCYMWKRVS